MTLVPNNILMTGNEARSGLGCWSTVNLTHQKGTI